MHAHRWIAGLLFVCVFALAGPIRAEQPQAFIDDLTLQRSAKNKLTVGFRVRHALDDRMVEMLNSGLPLRFLFRIRLVIPENAMFGHEVAEREFERVFEKDNLKEVYRVTEGEASNDFATLDEAIRVMGTVEQFAVIKFKKLDPKIAYLLEVKVRLEEFRLPFFLHRVLPFFSYWDEETPWHYEPLPANLWDKP